MAKFGDVVQDVIEFVHHRKLDNELADQRRRVWIHGGVSWREAQELVPDPGSRPEPPQSVEPGTGDARRRRRWGR